MLIRFHSKVGGFTIQGDIATVLLRLMGMSGDVPGAVLAKDVPQALERLKQGIPAARPSDQGSRSDEKEAEMSLATRAFPLVQLLESAAKRNCDVVWEELKRSTG
jgi:hypothetical protein